jgi:hypothetical protein
MNKFFLSIITILVIIAMFFTTCNRGSGRTEGSTQQQTASEEQTQTDAEPSLQIHTGENPIKIWGWSRDGIVGGSELKDTGGRGGITIRAFVFNTASDTILWEQKIDSFNFDDGYSDIPENEINVFFNNFHNICTQQFGINIQEGILLIPNEKIFNVIINAEAEKKVPGTNIF